MQDFLHHVPDTHTKVSTEVVETLIQSQQGRLFTGAMRLSFPVGETFLLTFLDGTKQNVYRYKDDQTEVVPQQAWSAMLDHPDASVACIKLSEDALRFVRVAHEAPVSRVERRHHSKQELTDLVPQWAADSQPSILRLQSDTADKLYLIARNSAPIIEELSWTGEDEFFSICDASFPAQLLLPEYRTTRYVSDGKHVIWQEYELRFAFSLLMRMMLNRFSELAGRILTERLAEQLSQHVTSGRIQIKITINGVANHQYFNSMADEIRVYIEILRQFRNDSATAIGVRLAENLVNEVLFKLDGPRQDLLKRHIYDPYMLDRTTGVGWR
jgi:hypothetical protein